MQPESWPVQQFAFWFPQYVCSELVRIFSTGNIERRILQDEQQTLRMICYSRDFRWLKATANKNRFKILVLYCPQFWHWQLEWEAKREGRKNTRWLTVSDTENTLYVFHGMKIYNWVKTQNLEETSSPASRGNRFLWRPAWLWKINILKEPLARSWNKVGEPKIKPVFLLILLILIYFSHTGYKRVRKWKNVERIKHKIIFNGH